MLHEMVYVIVRDVTAAGGGVPTSIRYVSSCEVVIAWCHCVTCRVTHDLIFVGSPLVDATARFSNDSMAELRVSKKVLEYIDMFNCYAQDNR